MRLFFCLVVTVFAISFTVAQAQADYFVWQDADTGLSLSFPDTWDIINSQQPDDLLTVMAPSGRGHAICRVRARSDGRFAVYPPRYSDEIQVLNVSTSFWDTYLNAYNDAEIYAVHDGAGLGRGFASYAVAGYDSAVPGPLMPRRALMFASLYGDTLYVLECSAHRDAFKEWKTLFLSIAGSVDFKKADHQFVSGNYRPFLGDPGMVFKKIQGESYVVY